MPYRNVCEKINGTGHAEAFYLSPFTSSHSWSVGEICRTVTDLCGREGRKYIYTYWNQPDYDMHEFGTQHTQVASDVRQINELVEKMCGTLSDTLVIVTADHGLIDTEWRYFSDYPQITECLERAPSVETRALSFFIKDGRRGKFESEIRQHFDDAYQLFTKEEVLSLKLFGGGTPHSRTAGFLGDYLAVAVGHDSIDMNPLALGGTMRASHAGMTADEMEIPFIAVKCV